MNENSEIIVIASPEAVLPTEIFWRGPASSIGEIHNVPAREAAQKLVETGVPQKRAMWLVFERPDGVSDFVALARAARDLADKRYGDGWGVGFHRANQLQRDE